MGEGYFFFVCFLFGLGKIWVIRFYVWGNWLCMCFLWLEVFGFILVFREDLVRLLNMWFWVRVLLILCIGLLFFSLICVVVFYLLGVSVIYCKGYEMVGCVLVKNLRDWISENKFLYGLI